MKRGRFLSITIISLLLITSPSFLGFMAQGNPSLNVDYSETMGAGDFQWAFAIITDSHVGGGISDFDGNGWDDGTSGIDGTNGAYLKEAISWINNNYIRENIKFVIFCGDLADSGEKSELRKGKEILDTLAIPYVPIIGNHDMWPYSGPSKKSEGEGIEAEYACGDEIWKDLFSDTFANLRYFFTNWNDGLRAVPTWDGEADGIDENGNIIEDAGCYSFFQCFSFDYGDPPWHFIFADFGTRDHAPNGYRGVHGGADLFDSAKVQGTWPWLRNHIASTANNYENDHLVIVTHFPPTKLDAPWGQMSFSIGEYNTITNWMVNFQNKIGYWFAGHYHMERAYDVKTYTFRSICRGIETGPTMEGHGCAHCIRVMKVYD
jgi:predicted MPP superfamily phosphohydrolase